MRLRQSPGEGESIDSERVCRTDMLLVLQGMGKEKKSGTSKSR